MKTKLRILSICCVLLFTACAVLAVFVIAGGDNPVSEGNDTGKDTSALPAGESDSSIQFKLSLLHLYYESNDVVSTLPFTTIQVSQGALIKAFMNTPNAAQDGLAYIDKYADRTIVSAFDTMDEILEKYQQLLTKYNISTSSSYRAKYNNLSSIFSSLKNSSNELLARTKTLIKQSKSSEYDSYYTNYIEQISDLTGKIESYSQIIMDEYDTILNAISDDYDILY